MNCIVRMKLGRPAAVAANSKQRLVRFASFAAGDKCVRRFDPMDEAGANELIKCAVNGDRVLDASIRQLGDEIVSAERVAGIGSQLLKNGAVILREADRPFVLFRTTFWGTRTEFVSSLRHQAYSPLDVPECYNITVWAASGVPAFWTGLAPQIAHVGGVGPDENICERSEGWPRDPRHSINKDPKASSRHLRCGRAL